MIVSNLSLMKSCTSRAKLYLWKKFKMSLGFLLCMSNNALGQYIKIEEPSRALLNIKLLYYFPWTNLLFLYIKFSQQYVPPSINTMTFIKFGHESFGYLWSTSPPINLNGAASPVDIKMISLTLSPIQIDVNKAL